MPVTIDGTTGITTPAIVNGTALAFRNKLINGNFDIWQRGTSLASGTGARYLADRFTNGSVTTTNTPSQQAFGVGQTDVPNQPDFFHRTVVSSGSVAGCNATLHQHIESVKTFAGKTVTLSFWAKATTAPENVAIEFHQYFGTGGSTAVSIPAGLFALTTSWQKFTVTANIPNINGKTIGASNDDYLTVYFWFDAGANFAARASNIGYQSGTFDIAQVQLEEGSVATPFEHIPIGTELALCQRYFEKSYDINIVPGTAPSYYDGMRIVRTYGITIQTANGGIESLHFTTKKRVAPVVAIYSPETGTKDRFYEWTVVDRTAGATRIATGGFQLVYIGSSITINTVTYHWTADAEL